MNTNRYVAFESGKFRIVSETNRTQAIYIERLDGLDALGVQRWKAVDPEDIGSELVLAMGQAIVLLSMAAKRVL